MKDLLKLARNVIESKLDDKELDVSEKIKDKYKKKQACFVTLTIGNELRGCIGSLEPNQEIWKDVLENSIHAAFHDFRFFPLRKDELDKIRIEISVLTIPRKLGIGKDVFERINKKMGIILKRHGRSSTFLPQVWEQLPDKTEFLENLSRKAGLNKDDWKDAEIWFYEVESFEE